MAVEYISSQFVTQTSSTGNNTISVPADCTLVMVTWGYSIAAGGTMTAASLNGVNLTKVIDTPAGTPNPSGGIWVLANPATGSQTLSTTFTENKDTYSLFVHYFKGVDTSAPVRDSANTTYQGTSPAETAAFDVVAGDLAVVVVSGYSNGEIVDADPTGKGQTEIYAWSTTLTKQNAVGTKAITTTGTTTMWGGGCDYNGINAVSLVPASSASQISVTDAGSGSDALADLLASLSLSDTGSGADLLSSLAAALGLTDSGSGLDSAQVMILISVPDAGGGAESPTIQATISTVDSGSGQETPAVLASLAVTDTGSGADLLGLIAEAMKTIADSGAGTDELSGITVLVPVSDSGAGVEMPTLISAVLSLIDAGRGTDVIVRYSSGDVYKRISVTFSGRPARIAISGQQPGIVISGQQPRIDISGTSAKITSNE